MNVSIPARKLSSAGHRETLAAKGVSLCAGDTVVLLLFQRGCINMVLFYEILCQKSSGERFCFGVDDVAPIQISSCQTQHQHFSGGHVAGKGNVVLIAKA